MGWMMRRSVVRGAVALTVLAMACTGTGVASADPAATPSSTAPATAQLPSRIVTKAVVAGQETLLEVYSAAMGRVIPLTVLRPKDTSRPAPVLYLLNGAGGGEDSATWKAKTDYQKFFADKHVNVVTPNSGAFSYYTDWQKDDPVLGRNKWQTFLTQELPPLVDEAFNTTGADAIAGISMAGTSVFNLAIAAPKLYRSVAAFSGCARTSDPLGQAYIRTVVGDRGRGDITNMWGPLDGPGWKDNDPFLHADKLKGVKVYMTTGTGLPGRYDVPNARLIDGNPATLLDQVLMGGVIEAVVDSCTQQMQQALVANGVDSTLTVRPTGTHSWEYWERELHSTWPEIAKDLAAQS
ncbi:alpha/beta hydrolase [Gordonia malaquae]|uniref:Putative mycolyltransferase n=1 Tax=Gordonia malaquae NBRC 108250 TaxID=1223542 RepID=M3VBA2_GORML|nr:putative mycolyltransferase [Gordonia malaquae NBRC 108250]